MSAKLYDLDPADNEPGENENAEDYTKIIPHAANIADFRGKKIAKLLQAHVQKMLMRRILSDRYRITKVRPETSVIFILRGTGIFLVLYFVYCRKSQSQLLMTMSYRV